MPSPAARALLAMICILAVFVPAFFMHGPPWFIRALAAGRRLCHDRVVHPVDTFVPVASVWLLRPCAEDQAGIPAGVPAGIRFRPRSITFERLGSSMRVFAGDSIAVRLIPPIWSFGSDYRRHFSASGPRDFSARRYGRVSPATPRPTARTSQERAICNRHWKSSQKPSGGARRSVAGCGHDPQQTSDQRVYQWSAARKRRFSTSN